MGGLVNNVRTGGNRTFVNIISGKISIPTTIDNPSAKKRFSERKKEDVYELHYDALEGELEGFEIEKSKFGTQLNIFVRNADELFQLQIPTESRYFTSFCDKVENLDLQGNIKIEPYNFESKTDRGKDGNPRKVIGISIYQGGEKIPNFYNKDHQGDKPPFPKDASERNLKRYYMDVEEYFIGLITDMSKMFDRQPATQTASAPVSNAVETDSNPVDDLPFAWATIITIAGLLSSTTLNLLS